MKNKLLALVAALFLVGKAHAEIQEIPKISFEGGVDYKTTCSEIDDKRACDSVNMINDRLGAAIKRNGSRRYVDTAISSNPVNSTYRCNISTNSVIRKALVAASSDRIFRSTNDISPSWVLLSSGLAPNQHYSFITAQNKVLMTGDGLQNGILSYDVANDTMGYLLSNDASSTTVIIYSKYHTSSRNYYITANVRDVTLSPSTTYYPQRSYYSLLVQPSSMTVSRFIDIGTDGEEITGIGEMFGRVYYFKPTSIWELSFTVLNLTSLGGDQVLTPMVNGFGCIAPRTLANTGQYFFFLAKDGIRIYDGGRRSRLDVSQESRVISLQVEPIINRIINSGTYANSVGIYYPKKQQYVFAYTDPDKFPKDRNNSVLVYDIPTGEWFPYKNWNIESMTTQDGNTDLGELLYGDSNDGYVYYADQESSPNDARKEIVLDTMDSTVTAQGIQWIRGTTDYFSVAEGTGAVRLITSPTVLFTSMSHVALMNLGEFYDKTPTSKEDKIAFRVRVASLTNLASLRVDLEINDNTPNGDFDANFTSVTLTSASLQAESTAWVQVSIPISSFPILADWTALSIESFPFAGAQTVYGIRFAVTGLGDASVTFDDLRLVQSTENQLRASRTTKQFQFNTVADKRFRQVVLNAEKGADSGFAIDVFQNFGQFSKRISVPAEIGKEIFVSGFGSTENVTKLNSIDFTLIASTQATNRSVYAIRPLTVDADFIYGGDQYNNRLMKINKSSMAVVVATAGALGAGTTNFRIIYQIAGDDENLYVCDFGNNRVKKHRKSNLEFVTSFGTLGQAATSYHNPTGVAVDERYLYVGQDGNFRIQKFDKSTGAYITSVLLNLNTIGDTTLHVDETYLYDAYNILNSTSLNHQDIILEQRLKSDLSLVNRVQVKPKNSIAISTYALLGDIGGSDQYIYISFTDNANGSVGTGYYIQKRLKSNLALVKEYKSSKRQYAVAANGSAYNPKRLNIIEDLGVDGSYLQLKYSEDGLDNNMKLYSQSFGIISEGFREK